MKFKIFKFKTVTSTNDMAINLIKKDNKENGCVIANMQTEGRGTHGKKWISEQGNLFGTIFFQLEKNYPSFSEFAIINPVIISGVIKIICKKQDISLKYPNDIFVNGKKICGILQEIITLSSKQFLIIGVGLNITSNPEVTDKYKATNILSENNKNPKVSEIMFLIVSAYEKFFNNLNSYDYSYFKSKAESMALN